VLALTPWRALTGVGTADWNSEARDSVRTSIFRDHTFLIFLAGVLLVGIVFFQHEAAMPLYLVRYLGLSPAFYGMLFTVNTLLIVALEVPLNTATSHWPNTRALVVGSALFAIGFGALAVVASPAGVIATVVVWTFGEMMLFPAMAAHLGDIAPENQRGSYMGTYSMALSVAFTIGPWMGTQILDAFGPVVVWTIMLALGLLAAILMSRAAPATGTHYATSQQLTTTG
jgi:predicted MFS family arabinose efflux permease